MRTLPTLLLGCALAGGPSALEAEPPLPDQGETELAVKIRRSQKLILPNESPTPVATGFRFADGLGAEFRADIDGEALLIDTDGDGTLETRIEGEDGFAVLVAGERRYGVSLTAKPEWSFTVGSAVVGEIDGTRIQVLDQNHNGRFDDVGEDALVVGNGRAAGYLSDIVDVNGVLLEIQVAPDGSKLSWNRYTGETATLVASANTEGKVLAAVLKSANGRTSVHLSKTNAELRVPAGEYFLDSGVLSLAGSRVKMRTGRSESFTVAAGERHELEWGGPVKAEFSYEKNGGELAFSPNEIWFYGAEGEEYFGWNPVGKSPRITVADADTGRELTVGYFPGSC
jgi:hypothetical protein